MMLSIHHVDTAYTIRSSRYVRSTYVYIERNCSTGNSLQNVRTLPGVRVRTAYSDAPREMTVIIIIFMRY